MSMFAEAFTRPGLLVGDSPATSTALTRQSARVKAEKKNALHRAALAANLPEPSSTSAAKKEESVDYGELQAKEKIKATTNLRFSPGTVVHGPGYENKQAGKQLAPKKGTLNYPKRSKQSQAPIRLTEWPVSTENLKTPLVVEQLLREADTPNQEEISSRWSFSSSVTEDSPLVQPVPRASHRKIMNTRGLSASVPGSPPPVVLAEPAKDEPEVDAARKSTPQTEEVKNNTTAMLFYEETPSGSASNDEGMSGQEYYDEENEDAAGEDEPYDEAQDDEEPKDEADGTDLMWR